jgi:hypothetical protein
MFLAVTLVIVVLNMVTVVLLIPIAVLVAIQNMDGASLKEIELKPQITLVDLMVKMTSVALVHIVVKLVAAVTKMRIVVLPTVIEPSEIVYIQSHPMTVLAEDSTLKSVIAPQVMVAQQVATVVLLMIIAYSRKVASQVMESVIIYK